MRLSCAGVWPLVAVGLALGLARDASAREPELERNNWAVLIDTSRYFYNYRHVSNTLVLYHTIKRLGIPDSNIILMLAEDIPCNSRNSKPGSVFRDHTNGENLYGEDVEVDYRGDEVSIENFLRLLTGRHRPNTPRNKRLLTDPMSNVLVYATGHSGKEFIKFQDFEELTSNDIADAFQQMYKQRRYRNIFWISDTCKAATLQNQFYSPNILAYGSSGQDENSYSHHSDDTIGAALVDRFTFYAYDFFQRLEPSSSLTVKQFTDHFDPSLLLATPEMRTNLFHKEPSRTKMTEFFASTSKMRFQSEVLELRPTTGFTRTGVSPHPELELLGNARRQTEAETDGDAKGGKGNNVDVGSSASAILAAVIRVLHSRPTAGMDFAVSQVSLPTASPTTFASGDALHALDVLPQYAWWLGFGGVATLSLAVL